MNVTVENELSERLRFDNAFTRELPADRETANFRRQVGGACFSRVTPTPVSAPRLVHYSREVAELLDLSPEHCESEAFAQVFAGNHLLPGMDPHATCYGGHQFGNWAGQLGDGRAINLGEVVNGRGQRLWLQLKGAGPTPYSRGADGLAVLRSSLREFLCSEAMHHLGVPTTRALSVMLTGEQVERDMFYDGNPAAEPGAVTCRVAPSFTRFGHFQILAARGDEALLRRLAEHTLRTDFPHLGEPGRDVYVAWFEEVCQRTLAMVVEWMRVGFVHGVMNTDNMSILGETIDYGPYGWLEPFDPDWTPNTTDAHGRRYRFASQPQVALWNLLQLANAIYPLIGDAAPLERPLNAFGDDYDAGWHRMMAARLGLQSFDAATDRVLFSDLLTLLTRAETDTTLFHRLLADVDPDAAADANVTEETLLAPLLPAVYAPEALEGSQREALAGWLRRYATRAKRDGVEPAERRRAMHGVNPRFVLRNYLAQLAIDDAEQGDFGLARELLDTLRRPYDEQPERERFAQKRPEWARQRAGCSMLSCSS